MLPKHMCDRPPRISYFAHKFSLTRFFPKKGVNFNFLRQNKYDKVRPISVTKDIILLIHIKKVRRLCHKAPKKHHTLPADVLPNASEALLFFVSKETEAEVLGKISGKIQSSRATNLAKSCVFSVWYAVFF